MGRLWLIYFMLTIVVVGFTLLAGIYFPARFLSRWISPLAGVPEWTMEKGVHLLMLVQPWFKAQVDIHLPAHHPQGLLIVSNHRSILDVFVLLSRVRGIRIMARSSLYRIPGLGLMMTATRQIRVERGQFDSFTEGLRLVKQCLSRGEIVHMFPEMTRCAPGYQGVQKLIAAPFLVAMQTGATVLPLVFKNTDGAWPKGRQSLTFRSPIEAKTLEPISVGQFTSAEELRNHVHTRMALEFA